MNAKALTRSALSAIVLSGLLAGCGGAPALVASAPMNAQVGAQSFKGVSEALSRMVQHKFYEKDANRNKVITPEEWGIQTPADFVEFRSLDDNGDGKIELKEVLPGFWDKVSAYNKVKKTARFMFKQLDKNGDKLISPAEAHELSFAGVEEKWSKFAGGKNKLMKKNAFEDYFAELMLNGDKNLKPGAKPPAAPAPAPADPAPAPADPAAPPAF